MTFDCMQLIESYIICWKNSCRHIYCCAKMFIINYLFVCQWRVLVLRCLAVYFLCLCQTVLNVSESLQKWWAN